MGIKSIKNGSQEDEEGSRVHQLPPPACDQVWKVLPWVQVHPQVAPRRQGQARLDLRQLPTTAQVRARVLLHVVQGQRSPLRWHQQRNCRGAGGSDPSGIVLVWKRRASLFSSLGDRGGL